MSTVSSIKLVLKDEVVRLPFTAPVTLGAIKAIIERQWPALAAAGADFGYTDKDNDFIRLTSEEGVTEALQHHGGPVLKIIVTPKTAGGAWRGSGQGGCVSRRVCVE